MTVTMVGVEAGDPADVADFDRKPDGDPHYLTFRLTRFSGGEEALKMLTSGLHGYADGGPAAGLNVLGTFEPCDTTRAPESFGPTGPSFETCLIYVSEGAPVDQGAYVGSTYTEENRDYRADPILWGP